MPLEPTIAEIFEDFRQSLLGELHVAMPGRVKSYDAAKQTADVVPCIRGAIGGSDGLTVLEDRPVIPNVPVAWTRGGGFSMTFPLAAGDHVWLVFNSDAIALWRSTGEVSEPGDLRRSTLSYPFAIPAAAPDSAAIADPGSSNEAVIGVPGGGTMRVGGPSADFVALAGKVDANFGAIKDMFDHWTPVANDGGAALKTLTGSLSLPATAATKLKSE